MSREDLTDNEHRFRFASKRALEIAALTAGGVVTAAILKQAGQATARRIAQERIIRRYDTYIGLMESDDASRGFAFLRRTAALSLVNYQGMSVDNIKRILRAQTSSGSHEVPDALVMLTKAGIIERFTPEGSRKREFLRPTAEFMLAVIENEQDCPRLTEEIHVIAPDFEISSLQTALPEHLQPE